MSSWFANLRIGYKLLVLNSLSAAALLVVGTVAFLQFRAVEDRWNDYIEKVGAKNDHLRTIRSGMGYGGAIHAYKNFVIRGDDGKSTYYRDFHTAVAEVRDAIKSYRACGVTPSEEAALRSLESMATTYSNGIETVRNMHDNPDASHSVVDIDDAVEVDNKPFLEAFDQLANELGTQLATQRTGLSADLSNASVTLVGIITTAIAITMLLGAMVARRISRPLVDLSRASAAIAVGSLRDVNLQTSAEHDDELGTLSRSFRQMVQYLTGMAEAADAISIGDVSVSVTPRSDSDQLSRAFGRMVQYVSKLADAMEQLSNGDLTVRANPRSDHDSLSRNFNDATTALSRMARRTDQAVTSITSSTTEAQAGVRELAASATAQATAVSETTATVEELRQSSEEVAERARNVSDLAREAATSADAGQRAVDETATGMKRIADRIDVIARAILALSEQTQAVGKITATVNDIAEQSKMLAFNAAIEAAKAGEFGKGFAVVATEIRTLADQSKQATSQIADILSDIQKASNQSVMVTEEGTRESERGMQLASQSGEKIRAIAEAIRSTAQNAMQIESATLQQSRGMDQIAQAMAAVSSTASQTQAAGSQMERAMQDLNVLAGQLKASIAGYKLGDAGDAD